MRILLIHNEYGAPSGEEAEFNHIGIALRRREHTVEAFTRSSKELCGDRIRQAGAFFSGVYNPFACKSLSRIVRDFSPDVALVQNLFPLISPGILPLLRSLGVPIVMRVSNYRLLCPNGLFMSHGEICERCASGREYWCVVRNCESSIPKSVGYALRNAVARKLGWYRDNIQTYLCASEFLKAKLVEAGYPSERIRIVRNIVTKPPGSNGCEPPSFGRYVAYAGRLSPEKGIQTFLRAAALCPDIPFRVAGRLRQGLKLLPNPGKNVQLLGFLQAQQLEALYAGARIVVVPSECYESFGMTVAEAMLWGRPVVVSRIGVFSELVKDGETGLHFAPGNDKDLAEKVTHLWNRPDRCDSLGSAARQYASAEYNEQDFYHKLMCCLIGKPFSDGATLQEAPKAGGTSEAITASNTTSLSS